MLIEQITIDTVRGQFSARMAGDEKNPLVMCLHGFPDDASTFDGLLEQLAGNGFRAVAPFCRGYAPSPLLNPDGSTFGKDLFEVLGKDVLAIADTIASKAKVHLVGHDNGAFSVYHLLQLAPERFDRVVTMTAGHPAAVFKNTMRSPAQLWRSRYAFFFQVPSISEWFVQRHDFTYLEKLWHDWAAPGWTLPQAYLDGVKQTIAASMPSPLLHYRSGGINGGKNWQKITAPTLYLIGAEDGCVLPEISAGQEDYFAGEFKSEIIPKAGHFLHLEQSEIVGKKVTEWLNQA